MKNAPLLAGMAILVAMVLAIGSSTTGGNAAHNCVPGPTPPTNNQCGGDWAVDMDPTGNTATTLGSNEQCARINPNGSMDADEDAVDAVFVDVTVTGILASNALAGFSFAVLNVYDSSPAEVFHVLGHNPSFMLNESAGSALFDGSDAVPDTDGSGRWLATVADTAIPGSTETGSGVLDRLQIKASSTTVLAGQYALALDSGVDFPAYHVDQNSAEQFPDTTAAANIAINQACGAVADSPTYHPVAPYRVLDTRDALGKVGANTSIDVLIGGTGGLEGVPFLGVTAVVLNATVTQPTAGSFLTLYPFGEPRPNASNLNFGPGQTVPNLVTVKVSSDGKISVYNAAGATHVILDVAGWYGTPTTTDGYYHPVAPARILDTRDGTGVPAAGKVGPGATIEVQITSATGSVPTGASAVVLNTTVTEPTNGSFLTVFPADVSQPTASNLNFAPNQTVPNLVIVKVSADGKAKIFNAVGSVHVIFDVAGWFGTVGTDGTIFTPLPPARILDTRTPVGGNQGTIGPAATIEVTVANAGGVPPTGATAVVLNTTITEPTAGSFLTVWPADVAQPTVSNLNFGPGQTVPNLVIVKLSPDGKVKLFNALGSVHAIFDVAGWYGPPPP